jgi:glycine/D-amino acid oxidase-like deaminating enzyme
MGDVLVDLLPDIAFGSFAMKPCLITDTGSGLPMIGRVDDGRIVARAGNGHAGKSADAIGALAAGLALDGRWTDPQLAETTFQPRFGAFDPADGSRHST